MEKYLIKKLGARYYQDGFGLNIEMGGYHNKDISLEQRQRISERVSGCGNPMYGRSGINSPNWGNAYKVNQYDLFGNFIRTWTSAREIGKKPE